MSSYTTGDWKLDTQDGYIRAGTRPIAQVFGATVHNSESTAGECLSNARLIQNAPKMYELLSTLFTDESFTEIERMNKHALELLAFIKGQEVANE